MEKTGTFQKVPVFSCQSIEYVPKSPGKHQYVLGMGLSGILGQQWTEKLLVTSWSHFGRLVSP